MVRNGKENSIVAYPFAAIKSLHRNSNLVEYRFNILRPLRIIYSCILSSNVIRKVISKRRSLTKKHIDEKLSGLFKPVKVINEIPRTELRIGLDEKETICGTLEMTDGGLRMSCGR